MALTELVELMKKIKELLEKQFIWTCASSWGTPILLVKKKDG